MPQKLIDGQVKEFDSFRLILYWGNERTRNGTTVVSPVKRVPDTVILTANQVESAVFIIITISLADDTGGGLGAAPIASIAARTFKQILMTDKEQNMAQTYVQHNSRLCRQMNPPPKQECPCNCCCCR